MLGSCQVRLDLFANFDDLSYSAGEPERYDTDDCASRIHDTQGSVGWKVKVGDKSQSQSYPSGGIRTSSGVAVAAVV